MVRGDFFSVGSRSREDVHDEIHHQARADIMQGGSEQHREQAMGQDRLAQAFLQIGYREGALVEELLHQSVVALGDHFHQGFVGFLGVGEEGCGDLFDFRLAVAIRRVVQRLHGDQVHHPAKTLLRTDW